MRNIISRLLIVVMLLFPVTVFSSSCGSTLPAQQQTVMVEYNTLSAVVHTVDLARGVYDDLWRAGKVSAELDAKVSAAYSNYQRVANLAIAKAKLQAAAANAGQVVTTNEYIAQLQDVINQLLLLFGTANPTAPPPAIVAIKANAGV